MEITSRLNENTPIIIIPAYNEENRIEKTINLILEYFIDVKIFIIMDGCTDRTQEIVHSFIDQRIIPLVYKRRLGKGVQ